MYVTTIKNCKYSNNTQNKTKGIPLSIDGIGVPTNPVLVGILWKYIYVHKLHNSIKLVKCILHIHWSSRG